MENRKSSNIQDIFFVLFYIWCLGTVIWLFFIIDWTNIYITITKWIYIYIYSIKNALEFSEIILTLLPYHEKSYVNSTMGSIWLHLKKKRNKSTVYYNYFFLQILLYNTGLYWHIDRQTRLCLGTFEYIEADREIYKNGLQNPKNIPQHFMCEFLIILHIVSLSVGICRYL
jgi:hypothetical protein